MAKVMMEFAKIILLVLFKLIWFRETFLDVF